MTAAPFARMAVRTVALALAAVTIATTFLGCATTGDIPVAIRSDQAIYISPANADGIQDAVTFDLLVTPLERTRLARYEVTITNSAGTLVSSESQQVPELGFFARTFGRERNAAVDPPEIVLWDGRNATGAFAGDGTYSLSVSVTDNRGNTGTAEPREIIVDNTPPALVVSAPYTLFTPNGDDRLDVISIYQRRSTREDLWTGEMTDAAGVVVKTLTWQGGARDFTWDGLTDAGPVAAEGTYTYRVAATDLAGNVGRFELAGITLERDPRPASVSVNRPSFSPNGDG
ncbi:MAG TPA: FlgD immunoglobulin-like domain containing protein, partial [Spirochaetia bacterium]|nr:FlgD immunoglobulin-like domain containing protein [Spirochaetia bacterium]